MSRFDELKPHKVVADAFQYKYIIAGRPKSGKTSLVHGIVGEKYNGDLSKLLLVAFEKGYNALDGIYAQDIDAWEDFRSLTDDLVAEKDSIPFKILAFDTVDVMGKMATSYVLKLQSRKDGKRYTAMADLAYGKGYDLLETEMNEQISKLDKAGYSLVFITHDKDKQFESRDGLKYDKTTLSLGGRVRDLVLNMVDFVVFVELGKELEKGKTIDKRYIYFRGDSGLEAGSRFTHIPNRIEYSYKGFIDTVEAAILAEYGGDEKAVEEAKTAQHKKAAHDSKEYVDAQNNPISAEELVRDIGLLVKNMSSDTKHEVAHYFETYLGNKDYRKSDDTDALQAALAFVKSKS